MEDQKPLSEPDEVSLCKDCPDEEVTVDDQVGAAIVASSGEGETQVVGEQASWQFGWRIDKYDGEVTPDMIEAGQQPIETIEINGNLLVNTGIQRLLDLLIGAGGQALNSTHSRIGVGDTTPTTGGGSNPAAADTDLQAATGSTHRQWKLVDSVARASQTVTWIATFATTMANFAWSEFGIDAGTADGTAAVTAPLLNHKTISAGTKTSAQTWVATATLTIS